MRYTEILAAAESAANCLLSNALKKIEHFCDKWGDYVHKHFFVPILKTYKDDVKFVRYVRLAEVGGCPANPQLFKFWSPILRKVPASIPPEFLHLGKWAGFHDALILSDHPLWAELKTELTIAVNAYYEAIAQRDEFMANVERIIFYYDTIDEAIAAWPAFRFFVPEDMRESDFDGTPKPLPEGINVAKLTAMVARARLMKE